MKIPLVTGAVIALSFAIAPAWAAGGMDIARMAACKDSWLDWSKNDPAQLKMFGDDFRANFSHKDDDAFFVPKAEESIAGLRVLQVFPQSVGMGVGFSAVVAAPFEKTRATMEKTLGKPLRKCDSSDGMKTCELEIAEQRTFMQMSEDSPKSTTTLVGCYYFYEK